MVCGASCAIEACTPPITVRRASVQPFPIASLQAKIIDYDADRMFEVLEDFSWEYEKVCHGRAIGDLCPGFDHITGL